MTNAKNTVTMTDETLQQLVKVGISAELERMNLEKLKAGITGISEGESDMAKRIKVRLDVDGKTRWVTGNTVQDTVNSAVRMLKESGEIASEARPSVQVPTFRDCAVKWFEVYKRPKLKENSAYNYEHDMYNHVLPEFGNKRIDEIRPSDIQAFLNTKKSKAKSTVHHIWLIIHGVFSTAVWDGYIDKDPTAEASRYTMSKRKAKREALSTEAVQDIINHLHRLEENDLCLLSLLIYTGMRRSEALGLRWEDIDFDRGLIHVQRAVTFKYNQPVVGTTKSEAGVRYIPLETQLRAILSPMRQLCGYVIGQDKPLTETAYKRTWERIGKKIDLHGATAHVFRHTYITMAAAHVDIKTLQSIAGHADISTTMNRYAHGRQDKIIAAGQALQTMYQ